MADLNNHKSAVRGSLEPLNTGGSLHVTHSLNTIDNDLLLKPPMLLCFSIMFFSIVTFILSSYVLFIVGDFFWTFALLVGGTLLAGLGVILKRSIKQCLFVQAEQCVIGLSDVVNFNDIDSIEVIKKTVKNKSHGTPYHSGEIRLLTKSNRRYLLIEGGNSTQMRSNAAFIASYLNVPLITDDTLYAV